MKVFKAADWIISTALILAGVIAVLLRPSCWWLAYLVIGGWQVFSLLVHRLWGWFQTSRGDRMCYTWAVGSIGLFVLLAEWQPVFGIIYLFLFITSPVLAAWYARLCFLEWRSCRQRPSFLYS
jgi:hypothetical protein